MSRSFEVTTSDVQGRINGVTFNPKTGQVVINASCREARMKPVQLITAEYLLEGGAWTAMSISPDGLQFNADIQTQGRWKAQDIIWNSFNDIDLTTHNNVQVRIQFKDADGTVTDYAVASSPDIDLTPLVNKTVFPLSFGKDTTPIFSFFIPSTFYPANMHFTLSISENADLSNPVQEIDSSVSQVGWEFEIQGNYKDMLAPGVPDTSAPDLLTGAKCRHTLQAALTQKNYYYGLTVVATKKPALDDLDLLLEDMDGYPCNY